MPTMSQVIKASFIAFHAASAQSTGLLLPPKPYSSEDGGPQLTTRPAKLPLERHPLMVPPHRRTLRALPPAVPAPAPLEASPVEVVLFPSATVTTSVPAGGILDLTLAADASGEPWEITDSTLPNPEESDYDDSYASLTFSFLPSTAGATCTLQAQKGNVTASLIVNVAAPSHVVPPITADTSAPVSSIDIPQDTPFQVQLQTFPWPGYYEFSSDLPAGSGVSSPTDSQGCLPCDEVGPDCPSLLRTYSTMGATPGKQYTVNITFINTQVQTLGGGPTVSPTTWTYFLNVGAMTEAPTEAPAPTPL